MRSRWALNAAGIAAAMAVALVGCAPMSATVDAAPPVPSTLEGPAASVTSEPTPGAVTLVAVVDGDTIETSAGPVRIIGIDTPERGECAADRASAAISGATAVGDPVRLELPAGQNDQDQYGRLLRYVTTSAGIDLGLLQLQAGNAVARYDSTDGYPAHPRESEYRAAQIASLSDDGAVIATGCRPASPPPVADRWWERYSSCTKLKKNTAGDPIGPFDRDDPAQAEIYDWFAHRTGNNGDGEGDGLACE